MLWAIVLVGGAAAIAGYLVRRNAADETKQIAQGSGSAPDVTPPPPPPHTDDAPMIAQATADAAEPVAAPADAVEAAAVPADAAGPDALLDDAGLPIYGTPDEEADPEKAIDLDPQAGKGSAADDEAADAPKTSEEVEKKPAPPAQMATTLHDAVLLIKDGKRDLALASLRALRKKNPKSAYIPFLLGNLYTDQRWWSVAMDDYADAIHKNPQYKSNPTLNRNVIRMLASPKTQAKASNFLRSVGHPAHQYLEYAAKHEDNPIVKKKAAELARYIR